MRIWSVQGFAGRNSNQGPRLAMRATAGAFFDCSATRPYAYHLSEMALIFEKPPIRLRPGGQPVVASLISKASG